MAIISSMRYLFGNSKLSHIILIVLFGLTIGIFVYLSLGSFSWQNLIFSILSVDIGAGVISNAREQTNIIWRNTKKWSQILFVVAHFTLYPAALILLIGFHYVLYIVLALLLIKTLFFLFGVIEEKRK